MDDGRSLNDYNTPMNTLANLNGQILPLAEAKVSVLDRGFLFGDGIYEAMHLAAGRIRFYKEHLARLQRSLAELNLGGVDLERLQQRITATVQAAGLADAFIYIQITRGSAPRRTHAYPDGLIPTELIYVEPFIDPYTEQRSRGIRVISFPDLRWRRCDIKSLNLLGNVLAARAAQDRGANEAILVADDGTWTEATRSSLFGVVDGRLRTGPNSPAILPGVTRGFILRIIRDLGLPHDERHLHRDEASRVAELFLTGTTAEVLPIVQVDDRPIGDGTPGPLTRKLQAAFREYVAKENP